MKIEFEFSIDDLKAMAAAIAKKQIPDADRYDVKIDSRAYHGITVTFEEKGAPDVPNEA